MNVFGYLHKVQYKELLHYVARYKLSEHCINIQRLEPRSNSVHLFMLCKMNVNIGGWALIKI